MNKSVTNLVKTTTAALSALVLIGCQPLGLAGTQAPEPAPAQTPATTAASTTFTTTVTYVYDGDTVAVEPVEGMAGAVDDYGQIRVRILGINAPELNPKDGDGPQCGAQSATDTLSAMVGEGVQVTLRYDQASDHVDRYGRALAYLELADGSDVGAAMVATGWALPYHPTGEPAPSRFGSYQRFEHEAIQAGSGVHGHC